MSGRVNPLNREALWLTGYPTDAPLYNLTASLNIMRRFAAEDSSTYLTTPMAILSNTTNMLAIKKDRVITLINNYGDHSGTQTVTIPLEVPRSQGGKRDVVDVRQAPGTVLLDIISCHEHKVNDQGELELSIKDGLPMVFYERDRLKNSAVCNGGQEGGLTVNPNIVALDPPPRKSDAQGRRGEWLEAVLGIFGALLVGGML